MWKKMMSDQHAVNTFFLFLSLYWHLFTSDGHALG